MAAVLGLKGTSRVHMVKKHPFATFVVLAFALSCYPWVLHLTRLVPRALGMNPLGVLAAAFITATVLRGGVSAKELLARLVRFRVHPTWYAFALGLPVVVAAMSLGISVLLGAKLDAPFRPDPLALLRSFLFMFFFVGVGEETGWRGFAIPELLKHHSWPRVALQVGAVWALWHAPLFGNQISWHQLPAFVPSVFAASVVLTFLSFAPVLLFRSFALSMAWSTPSTAAASFLCLVMGA